MKSNISRWRNGAAIRIPDAIMRAADLKIGQDVDIREADGQIVIEPVRVKGYTLAELVEGITPDNQHSLIDFGDAVGREVW